MGPLPGIAPGSPLYQSGALLAELLRQWCPRPDLHREPARCERAALLLRHAGLVGQGGFEPPSAVYQTAALNHCATVRLVRQVGFAPTQLSRRFYGPHGSLGPADAIWILSDTE
jgi:hypothetical protein